MPKRNTLSTLTSKDKLDLIKAGRAHATMLSNVLKSLGHYPKAVDKMMGPILKALQGKETAVQRDREKEREERK